MGFGDNHERSDIYNKPNDEKCSLCENLREENVKAGESCANAPNLEITLEYWRKSRKFSVTRTEEVKMKAEKNEVREKTKCNNVVWHLVESEFHSKCNRQRILIKKFTIRFKMFLLAIMEGLDNR